MVYTTLSKTKLRQFLAVLFVVICLLPLTCNYATLLFFVIRLDVPTPSGSIVNTSLYRTEPFPRGYLVWDRYYRIPTSSFESTDGIVEYFDDWLRDHAWGETDLLPCNLVSGVTVDEVAQRVTENYEPLDYQPYEALSLVCLMITPTPLNGYYDVRLITSHEGLFYGLDD